MGYQKSFTDTIKTSLTKIPHAPQYRLKNPLKENIFCNGIELLPDPMFTKKGEILVMVGGAPVFSTGGKKIGNYALYPVPLENQEFLQGEDIEVYAWNGVDTDEVSISFNIILSDSQGNLARGAQAIDQSVINDAVSEFDSIFPLELRAPGISTRLVDMKGYKKIILMISSAPPDTPTVIIGGAAVADGDLDTAGPNVHCLGNGTKTVISKVDFGSVASRVPFGKMENVTTQFGIWTRRLEVSENDADWTVVDSTTTGGVTTLSGAEQSFRYLRLTAQRTSGDASDTTMRTFELWDGLTFGGTAEISFEILDRSSGNWVPLITASDIGATSQGEEKTKTIGDVINDVSNDKFNYALPSTQTDFRAKLEVKTAATTISVSIMRI